MIAPLPFRLDQGIFLEDSGTLLPWGTPLDQLADVAGPEVMQATTSRQWVWSSRRCLDGLLTDVHVSRFLDDVNPRAYRLYLDHFHFATLQLQGLRVPNDDDLRREFRRIYDRLANAFGGGHWSYPMYNSGLPAVFWDFPSIQISFLTMGRGHVAVSCSHEPTGYKELRDEAAALMGGRGARVDQVVW